jgi:basic membrane protein A and related proteins
MHKKSHLLLAGLLIFVLTISACQQAAAPATAPEATQSRVAVIYPGVVSDESWNQFGHAGLRRAEQDCGVQIAYSENVHQAEQLETFRNYASQGYNIIIGHGGEFQDAIEQVATEFPNIEFGVTNGLGEPPNVSGIKISYAHMGYLAGYLACEMTNNNHIAFLGGEPIPIVNQAMREYQRAAQTCGKGEVRADEVITGAWADVTRAYEASRGLISGGADVLWHVLDTADAGLIAATTDSGVYSIGLYRDSSDLGPESVIGSAIGDPGALIYKLACGEALVHQDLFLDVNMEGGVDIHFTDLTPADVQERTRAVLEQIRSGEISVEP